MIDIANREECCGCTACATVCAHGAIEMQPDGMGFEYPVVDASKCVACGLCSKVCAFQRGYDTTPNYDTPLVYAARHKEMSELLTSRSGGVFPALARTVIAAGGTVYGVALDSAFRAVHRRATTAEECIAFKGSKYVQSHLGDSFIQVKRDLESGVPVLFSGTPCQTAGLRAYLPTKLQEKLLLCDVVCHGAPSPAVWSSYVAYIEKKYKKRITKIEFRDKEKGWKKHYESFRFQDDSKVLRYTFTCMFYKHIMLRPSCGVCKYTNFHRPSDITLADYWGWEKLSRTFNKDNKGCSLLLLNSPKGKKYFDAIASELHLIPSSTDRCLQHNLQQPTTLSKKSCIFEQEFAANNFAYISDKYGDTGSMYPFVYIMNEAIAFPRNCINFVKKRL